MNSNDYLYLRINHKNTLDIPNRNEKSKLILSIFTTIASVQEDQIGKELNKYFDNLIPNNNTDLYHINFDFAEKYYTKYQLNNRKICNAVNSVLEKDYGTTFSFEENNTEDIMCILVFSFKELCKYNVSSYDELMKRIEDAVTHNYDAVRLFIDNTSFTTLDSFSMRSISFISTGQKCNDEDNQKPLIRSTGTMSKYDCNQESSNMQFIPIQNIFTYPKINRKKRFKDILPIEMIILLNKFQSIKKFSFEIKQVNVKQLHEITIILLNAKWLFPNLFEIDFDLTDAKMQKEIEEIFKKKLSHLNKKTTMYSSEDSKQFTWAPDKETDDDFNYNNIESLLKIKSQGKIKTKQEYSYKKYIQNKTSQIEIIIIYSYFLSHFTKLQSLSLTFQDSFSMEIEELLRLRDIYYVDFHFLTFCSRLESLHELRVIFNSLDLCNFQKMLGIINSNQQLFKLRISFFTSDENYSPVALYKLCKRLKLNVSEIFNEKILSIGDNNFENGEVDHLIINKLLSCFEENLEKLFHVLFNYLNIQELILFFALPKIISNNDSYIMVLLKFVINFLLFLSNEQHNFKVFKLIAPLLWFNYRKYPFIEGCIEEVHLESNITPLRDFTIQMGFDNVTNVSRMISTRLEQLFIGDFDMETFACFIKYYTSHYFIENSQLVTVTISLNNKIVNYQEASSLIHHYFSNQPKYLIEQNLSSYLQLQTKDEANDIIKLIFETNKMNNNIEICEGKEICFNQILNNYLNIPRSILLCYARKHKKRIMNEEIINKIKELMFINKRNPFRIRDK